MSSPSSPEEQPVAPPPSAAAAPTTAAATAQPAAAASTTAGDKLKEPEPEPEAEPRPEPKPAALTAEERAAFEADEQEDDMTPHEMLLAQFPPMDDLRAAVADAFAPLGMRMRAVYYLRTIATLEAIEVLATALLDTRNTPLMRHELAYVLGQIRNPAACDTLEQVLADEAGDAMVRHESAEALGSIGEERSVALLERCSSDAMEEVAETCAIAADFVKWKQLRDETKSAPMMCACMNPYNSHDPAPSDPEFDTRPTAEVAAVLIDTDQPLFRRYSAMFSLRNRGGEDAVRALGHALITDDSSALVSTRRNAHPNSISRDVADRLLVFSVPPRGCVRARPDAAPGRHPAAVSSRDNLCRNLFLVPF